MKTLDNMTVGELRTVLNWGGDERTTVADALAQHTAATAATAEHEAIEAERQRARDDWLQRRDTARRVAHFNALAGRSSPEAHAKATEAANAARLKFERDNPLPPGLPERVLGEQPSMLERAAAKVGLA